MKLYAAGERTLRITTSCEWKDGKCLDGNGCCHGCKHLSRDPEKPGCTVKSLACKLSLCAEAARKFPQVWWELCGIRDAADQLNIPHLFRGSMEENFHEEEKSSN